MDKGDLKNLIYALDNYQKILHLNIARTVSTEVLSEVDYFGNAYQMLTTKK